MRRADGEAVKNEAKLSEHEGEKDEDVVDYTVYYPTVLPNKMPGSQLDPGLETTAAVIPPEFTEENVPHSSHFCYDARGKLTTCPLWY